MDWVEIGTEASCQREQSSQAHVHCTLLPLGWLQVLKKLRRLSWAENEPYLLATLLRASHKG